MEHKIYLFESKIPFEPSKTGERPQRTLPFSSTDRMVIWNHKDTEGSSRKENLYRTTFRALYPSGKSENDIPGIVSKDVKIIMAEEIPVKQETFIADSPAGFQIRQKLKRYADPEQNRDSLKKASIAIRLKIFQFPQS